MFFGVADYLKDILNIETNTKIAQTSFSLDGTKYLNKANVNLDGTAKADLNESRYDIDQKVGINNLKLNLDELVSYKRLQINSEQYNFVESSSEKVLSKVIFLFLKSTTAISMASI